MPNRTTVPIKSASPGELRARIQDALNAGLVRHWPYPEDEKHTLVLEARGAGEWTVSCKHGLVHVRPSRVRKPTGTVSADARTLAEVLEGRRCGVETWLKGYLMVRGSIALALKLEGLLRGPRPRHFARPGRVKALGIDTFYVEAGEGDPVILLHGLSATGASMLPTLPVLAKTHRVIVPDLPGFGDSAKPLRRYHAEFFAEWVTAFMDSLGVKRATLIGNSMGGRISIETGLRYPDRVERLVLYCPAVAFRKLRHAVPVVKWIRPELGVAPLAVALPRRVAYTMMSQIFSKPDRVPRPWFDAAADEFFRIFATRRGRIALFSAAKEIYLDDPWGKTGFWKRLERLTPPALFIWGDRDILVPSGFHHHVVEALPSAHSIVIEDCGHVPQFELPDVIHPMVEQFIADGTVTVPSGAHAES